MFLIDFVKQLNEADTDWIIDPAYNGSESVGNYDYLPVICKNCGSSRQHTVGNLKHTIKINPEHCRCRVCKLKQQQVQTSKNLLDRMEKLMLKSSTFPWYLDRSKLLPGVNYEHKTPLPLICKTCSTPKKHNASNIQTALRLPKHIVCIQCKEKKRISDKLQSWKERVRRQTKGAYEMDVEKTDKGYKITHLACGNYYYLLQPIVIKDGSCALCKSDSNPLRQLTDDTKLSDYILKETKGKSKFHSINRNTRDITISCNIHPREKPYTISWDAFVRCKRYAESFKCNSCFKDSLRKTSSYEYNQEIAEFGLSIKYDDPAAKIDMKEKILHQCTIAAHHPPFYASPYEVRSKNKRCIFCYNSISYHKGYDFIKSYVEMDQDRFFTHQGKRFRLLSSKEEVEGQIRGHQGGIKIRINELTCDLHDEFELTWGSFYSRHASCTKCRKERWHSYAHSYYHALLVYFKISYVPEFPVKLNSKSTYRIDFKLDTFPNYVEIDSSLHVNPHAWDNDLKNGNSYLLRDQQKNEFFKENLERIILYNDENQPYPLLTQLNIIETAFLKRVVNTHLSITTDDILLAKRDPKFFSNARIAYKIARLKYYHEGHIEFNSSNHLDILLSNENNVYDFKCLINQKTFKRSLITVSKIYFLCPVCQENLRKGQQSNYFIHQKKLLLIQDVLEQRFQKSIHIELSDWEERAFYFAQVVFPAYVEKLKRGIYISIRELLLLSFSEILSNFQKGRYRANSTKNVRYFSPHKPVIIETMETKIREKLHQESEKIFSVYQKQAKLINQLLRDRTNHHEIDKMIMENEQMFTRYVHESDRVAKRMIATYDRHILPFFNLQPDFSLMTSRDRYVHNKQFLLLKGERCSHQFYLTWSFLKFRLKHNLGVQCQHKDCFSTYYSTRYRPGNKVSQEKILQQFKQLFKGQYYPAEPLELIKVRERIDIIHLSTGKLLKVSFDNFRRGKFRCPYKNL